MTQLMDKTGKLSSLDSLTLQQVAVVVAIMLQKVTRLQGRLVEEAGAINQHARQLPTVTLGEMGTLKPVAVAALVL